MQCNGNFKQWFNIFLIISEARQLQSKKLSRTRDIPNFPTQGWADTAFYTHNWSETYWSQSVKCYSLPDSISQRSFEFFLNHWIDWIMTKHKIGMVTRNTLCLITVILSDEVVKLNFYSYLWIDISIQWG